MERIFCGPAQKWRSGLLWVKWHSFSIETNDDDKMDKEAREKEAERQRKEEEKRREEERKKWQEEKERQRRENNRGKHGCSGSCSFQ